MVRTKTPRKKSKRKANLKCYGDICVTEDGRVEVKVADSCPRPMREQLTHLIGVEGKGVEVVMPKVIREGLEGDKTKKMKQIDESIDKLLKMKRELEA